MGNYISPEDVSNWPSGTEDSEKELLVEYAETLFEKATGLVFYAKPFDMSLNGKNSNRLFIPVGAKVLSVDRVWVCGVELSSSYWNFDADSVYYDPCKDEESGALLTDDYTIVTGGGKLFPRGYNNIRVRGTYGEHEEAPEAVKKACVALVEAENSGLKKLLFESEKIGRYSYDKGDHAGTYTGIPYVDSVIALYRKQKRATVMTP